MTTAAQPEEAEEAEETEASTLAGAHVIVVGGGPAGLTAATGLRAAGVGRVTVIEREQQAGGVPRHTDHLGFGLRDLRRLTTGPRYAERLRRAAHEADVQVRTSCTVIELTVGRSLARPAVVLADGTRLEADAVVLATGVRERPRAARLIPGDRPSGVYTTGAVQQHTALHHHRVGRRAVIVGAEHVSFSAIWSLRHGGCTTVAMITPLHRHQSVGALRLIAATARRIPVHTGVRLASIEGRPRVEAVVLDDGRRIACDTVVFTGDWVPDHEVAVRAGLMITRGAGSPTITSRFATSQPGVFAIGNLVHPADAADQCALDGRAVVGPVIDWVVAGAGQRLDGRSWTAMTAPITVEAPISWASFSARGLTVRVVEHVVARVEVSCDGAVVALGRRRHLVPNRSINVALPSGTVDAGRLIEVRLVEGAADRGAARRHLRSLRNRTTALR